MSHTFAFHFHKYLKVVYDKNVLAELLKNIYRKA